MDGYWFQNVESFVVIYTPFYGPDGASGKEPTY